MQSQLSPFREPSLAWFSACETALRSLRAKTPGLAPNASLCFHPSVEAALIEWTLFLLDRNRETGAGRTGIVLEADDDPCLRFVGQVVSSQSLVVAELMSGTVTSATALFCAFCDDDRFEAMEREHSHRDKVLSDVAWQRVPLIRIRQLPPPNIASLPPRPYEIKIVRLDDGSAVSILGDRLRFVPRLSQHAFQAPAIYSCAAAFAALLEECDRSESYDSEIAAIAQALAKPEANTAANTAAALPQAWRILEPRVGERRCLHRIVLVTESLDSSWCADRLIAAYPLLRRGVDVVPLSGCEIGDERLQEWLRARANAQLTTPLAIRGALQFKVPALLAAIPGENTAAKAAAFCDFLKSICNGQ